MTRILVVEDEVIISMRFTELLKSMGYDVVGVAATGKEAVEMARDLNPEIILMDIVMPGEMDGIAAAEKIKSELDIPVIFVTGHAEEGLVDRAKHAEPFGYILKPFLEKEIEAAIEIAFYKKNMERKLKRAYEELEEQFKEKTAHLVDAKKQLEIKTIQLEETNQALNILLKKREKDKEELEARVVSNVRELIEPYLEKLKKSNLSPEQEIYLSILDSNLKDISSPFIRSMAIKYAGLTHKEIQVAGLVKEGKKTKEIAKLLNTTKRAVEFHRHSLRTKLGLTNRKANLRSHLLSLP